MGKRLVTSQTVYFPGTDESAAADADVMLVTETDTTISFRQLSLAGAYTIVFDLSSKADLIENADILIGEYNADGTGGELGVDTSDSTRKVTLNAADGRIGFASGTNADSFPVAVWDQVKVDL